MNECHAEDGKFCEGGAGSGSGTSRPSQSIRREGKAWKTSDGKALPKHLDGLRIPPAWTDVQVNPDPEGSLLVTGHDAKGRLQYVYSAKFMDTQKAAKFERITALDREFDQIKSVNGVNRADPAKAEEADCLHLIMETGIRPGSDRDTKAEKQAFGATTLRGEHVKQTDSGVRLQYVGKKGVDLDIPISDPETARMLVDRAERAGVSGRLFDTDSHTLLAYTHTLGSGSFKTKDFRTLVGTSMAKTEIAKMPKPATKTAFKKQVSAVAKAVASKLGNTPSVALKSYIAPEVFAPWQSETQDTAKAHSDGEPLFGFGIMIGTACSLRHRDAGISVRDEGDADGNDEDIPCPPEVRMALGFDPDELDGEDKSNACACVGDHCFFGNAEAVDPSGHVAVLQGLNEWINYARPTGPQRFFYGTDDFSDSVNDWEKVPVVFAQQHPAHRLISSNLEEALQSVTAHDGGPGRLAGNIKMPLIVNDALMSEVAFDDPYVQRMHAEKRLALSTGFTAGHDETGHLTETVKPNHLLVFVTDESNRPRDPNTGFLNKEGEDVVDGEQESPETTDEGEGRVKQLIQAVLKALDGVFVPANALSKAVNDPGDPSAEEDEEETPEGKKKPAESDEAKQKGNQAQADSFESRQSVLQRAVSDRFAKPESGSLLGSEAWIQSTYPDRVVFRGLDGRLFEVSYAVLDGVITLGEPTEVEVQYTPKGDKSNAEYPFDTCVEDQIAKGYSEDRAKRICGYIKAKNNLLGRSVMGGQSPNGADSEEVIMGTEMDTLKSQLEAANKTVADQKTELEAANQRLAAFKKKEADVAWANMRDTHVPRGWLAGKTDEEKANKESELRKEFEDAPIAFANKLLAHAKGLPKGGDKSAEEGNSYANKDGEGGANDVVSTTRELRALSGRR
jgi:DNA topoisomerase-1